MGVLMFLAVVNDEPVKGSWFTLTAVFIVLLGLTIAWHLVTRRNEPGKSQSLGAQHTNTTAAELDHALVLERLEGAVDALPRGTHQCGQLGTPPPHETRQPGVVASEEAGRRDVVILQHPSAPRRGPGL